VRVVFSRRSGEVRRRVGPSFVVDGVGVTWRRRRPLTWLRSATKARAHGACRLDLLGPGFGANVQKVRVVLDRPSLEYRFGLHILGQVRTWMGHQIVFQCIKKKKINENNVLAKQFLFFFVQFHLLCLVNYLAKQFGIRA
jgi:hypothetical protein